MTKICDILLFLESFCGVETVIISLLRPIVDTVNGGGIPR